MIPKRLHLKSEKTNFKSDQSTFQSNLLYSKNIDLTDYLKFDCHELSMKYPRGNYAVSIKITGQRILLE